MAEHEYELTLKWENEKSFQMTAKKDAEEKFTVVKMDENNSISLVWPHVSAIIRGYFNKITGEIGTEMKS